jgi:tetratricopeptide (TPR) repeat protein
MSLDTTPKAFAFYEKMKNLMKSLRSDEVGPGIELSESEYLFDFEVLIEWATLLEESDMSLALKCIFNHSNPLDCEHALQILRNTENYKIPAELLNNVAVMNQIQMENSSPETFEKIQMLYGEALKMADLDNSSTTEATKLTVKFNIATFYEVMEQNDKAEDLYLELIEAYPSYLDCNLFP